MLRILKLVIFVMGGMIALGLGNAYSEDEIESLVSNGGFEDGVLAPLMHYDAAGAGIVVELVKNPPDPIEGQFAVRVETPKVPEGANFWDAGVGYKHTDVAGQNKLVYEKGKVYTVAIFMKSEDFVRVNIKMAKSADPWTTLGQKDFALTDQWQECYITTDKVAETLNPGENFIYVLLNKGELWMDAYALYEGAYIEREPGSETQRAVQPQDKLAVAWGTLKKSDK